MQDEQDRDVEMDQAGIQQEIPEDPDFDDEFDDDDESEDLTVVEKIIGVYTSPVKTFKYIAEKPDFWWPLIIISLILIGVSVMVLPKMMPFIQEQAVENIMSSEGMSDAQKEDTIAMMMPMVSIGTYVQVGLMPVLIGIAWLASTLIVFLVGLVMGLETDFKRLLGVIPWLSFISVLSEVAKNLYIFFLKDLPEDLVTNPAITKPFSAAILVANNPDVPGWLKIFLTSVDPFVIWSLIVMVFALEAANKCTRSQAITTTIIVVIIGALLTIGLSFLQTGLQVNAS